VATAVLVALISMPLLTELVSMGDGVAIDMALLTELWAQGKGIPPE
jgi:hypothetical protein